MKILELIKKVSKILLYLSVAFSALYAVIAFREVYLIETTTNGSAKAVECKISVSNYQKENKLLDTDPKIIELNELCGGVSSQRVKISTFDYQG